MKIVIFLSFLVVVSLAKGIPDGETLHEKNEIVEWSPGAKYLLKEASLRAISFLCFGENSNEEINERICKKAIWRMSSNSRAAPSWTNNCIDCDVADPICWDACPQGIQK